MVLIRGAFRRSGAFMRSFLFLTVFVGGAASADVVVLDTPAKAAALCASLQPVERLRFNDGPVDAPERKAAYVAHRKEAVAQMYQLTLQPKEFLVSETDSKEGTVTI